MVVLKIRDQVCAGCARSGPKFILLLLPYISQRNVIRLSLAIFRKSNNYLFISQIFLRLSGKLQLCVQRAEYFIAV